MDMTIILTLIAVAAFLAAALLVNAALMSAATSVLSILYFYKDYDGLMTPELSLLRDQLRQADSPSVCSVGYFEYPARVITGRFQLLEHWGIFGSLVLAHLLLPLILAAVLSGANTAAVYLTVFAVVSFLVAWWPFLYAYGHLGLKTLSQIALVLWVVIGELRCQARVAEAWFEQKRSSQGGSNLPPP